MEFFQSLIPVGIVVLCLAGAVALIALAYLLVNLVQVIKEAMAKLNPILDDTQEIVTNVKPAIEKVDPLMDRATLTMDAVNLEIMRVDQILEDVNNVSTTVSKATNSLDAVTSAPLDFISNATGKIREIIAPHTSKESSVGAIAGAVDYGLEAVGEKTADMHQQSEVRRVERESRFEARCENLNRAHEVSDGLKNAQAIQANETTSAI